MLSEKNSAFQKAQKKILAALSFLYGAAVWARNKGFDQKIFPVKKAAVPVISVGNVSLGGTGKTSLTIWIVEQMIAKMKNPVVLSRGYGRSSSGPAVQILSKEAGHSGDPSSVGDEPVLIAQNCSEAAVVVGACRTQTAEIACEKLSPDCLVLDDGFQHRWLSRDLDIVCVDERLFKAPFVFPRGFLREPLRSLRRADFIVIKNEKPESGAETLIEQCSSCCPGLPSAVFFYRTRAVKKNKTGELLPAEWLKTKKLLAFSGIANSEGFESLLKEGGGQVCLFKKFPDHHTYAGRELELLLEESEKKEYALITTEKDGVKMPKGFPVYILQVGLEWQRGEDQIRDSIFGIFHEEK